MFASNFRLQFSWSFRMLPKAHFHYLRGSKQRATRVALHNCGYETAGIAQDAEICLEIKPTATSDWHIAKYLPLQQMIHLLEVCSRLFIYLRN
jgi:hypothetical protein